MIGQEVLGYRVEELLGRGSFASVYKVKKENESGTYIRALKHIVIPEQMQYQRIWNAMGRDKKKTEHYFERVFQETMQEIRLLHDFTASGARNIVACYENDVILHEAPRRYEIFILMEYLTTFSAYISENDLTVEEVLNLGIQILDALIFCHHRNVIHRDVKEDNIFITPDGVCKLGDFGVAKVLRENGLVFSLKGTAEYMAPEVYRNAEDYDKTIDLYSLGIVLYRLLNHMRGPFFPEYPGGFCTADEEKALRRRMNGEPLPMPDMAPESLGKVILKSLSVRNTRYQNAEDFKRELLRVRNSLGTDELQRSVMTGEIGNRTHIICMPEGGENYSRKKRKNKRGRIIAGAITVSLIFAVGAGGYLKTRQIKIIEKQKKWEGESIFPFECISTEMAKGDFEEYYGDFFTEGTDNQYYLKVKKDDAQGYAAVVFEGNAWKSISYSFKVEEKKWKTIIQEFYHGVGENGEKWPYIVEKDSVRIMLDYDKISRKAVFFANQM